MAPGGWPSGTQVITHVNNAGARPVRTEVGRLVPAGGMAWRAYRRNGDTLRSIGVFESHYKALLALSN